MKWIFLSILAFSISACVSGADKSKAKGLSLSVGLVKYPLGSSIYELPGFPYSDTVYESNWNEDTTGPVFTSDFARLWRLRWGDFSYLPSKEGHTLFFKRGKIFAQLISARGKENELDLENGIYVGMSADSAARILNVPKYTASKWHQFITDSLAVYTLDERVTSYCIFSRNLEELFCNSPVKGLVGFIKRSVDTASTFGARVYFNNCLCADEERDKVRIQFESCGTSKYADELRSRHFEWDFSAVFWFDKKTGNLLRVHRPRLN